MILLYSNITHITYIFHTMSDDALTLMDVLLFCYDELSAKGRIISGTI